MLRAINRTRLVRTGDEGIALVGVIGLLMVLTLFLLATLAFTLQNLKPTRRDQDAKTALAAAQAGVDDYIARLNGTPGYWRNLNVDSTNPALMAPAAVGAGRTIPGTSGNGASYRYSVLSTAAEVSIQGAVRIKATGTSRGVQRSLTATIQPRGFLQFIYHTDLETLDPALFTSESSSLRTACATYYRDGRSTSSCTDIQFGSGDVITGPLHTNDSIYVGTGGVTFSSPVTETSWPATGSTRNPASATQLWRGTVTPSGNRPVYAPILEIPQENTELRAIAATTATDEGCIYQGGTRITFTGTTMTVLSPNTTSAPSRCYNTSAADKALPQTGIRIPSVIYVEDKTGGCVKKSGNTIGLGYPLSGEYVGSGGANYSGDYIGPTYNCDEGTAYVEGTVDGATTLASTQDVVLVGNLNYQSEAANSDDVVGIIPGHFTWVYHPVLRNSSGAYLNMLTTPVTQVDAAILSVKDSFVVQNYNRGAKVTTGDSSRLRVYGAIAQKFRGPVGTSGGTGTGYVKNYIYDTRFQNGMQPPYFLQPVAAQWSATSLSDG